MLAIRFTWALAGGTIGTAERTMMSVSFFGWGAAACAGMGAAGRLGLSVARWLDWPIAGRELRVQQILLVAQALLLALGVALMAIATGWSGLAPQSLAGVMFLLITVSPVAIMPGVTAAGLSRLAIAVERDRGELRGVLETDPESHPGSNERPPDQAEIPLP
jgi:hypothetical protein